ncbi:MAG: alpha-galactosidase [Clostridiaceae bacterium]|nr:alpha-galactosidase [Clostridiales bacterium]MDD6877908.1 alpha-galactosidase [Clostridiaceae bacterium]MDY3286303.1 alpha-galactosidase [Eubacteriales bacterium]
MKKIAFIGAGSFGFTRTLVKDILSFPAFADAEIALMDINPERLSYIERACRKIVERGNYPAKITATMNRAEALEGADGVLITILSGGVQVWRHDIEIPKKYGVDINVGDTRGPAGIFRYLRTVNDMLDIGHDIDRYCPNAIVLNYTNPMAMLCRTLQGECRASITGLCHSVQGTAEMLARWIGADMKDVTYLCAGINHQAFYLDYKVCGEDAYPRIRRALENPDIYNEEQVRNEMFYALGYYVTESSGHNSEYNAWFRKRPDLIEKYCTNGTGWNPGHYAYILGEYLKREDNWKHDIEEWLAQEDIDISRGHEYAAWIFNAVFGDNTMYEFNGNVRNFGLIDNLPEGACVEVPVVASKAGLRAVHVGALPPQLALLTNISSRCEELAIEGSLEGDREKIYHAILFDPLTSAVLSPREIRSMVDEMFAANEAWLPQFRK